MTWHGAAALSLERLQKRPKSSGTPFFAPPPPASFRFCVRFMQQHPYRRGSEEVLERFYRP